MSDNQTVNSAASYSVKTTELGDTSHIQHVRIDLGSGASESVASGSLPVNITSGGGDATAANQALEIAQLQAIYSLQQTMQELVSRLDTLAACKYHLNEALRVQLVGSVALSAVVTSTDITAAIYQSPAYAKFLPQVAMGNTAAILGNINNVVIS